MSRTYAEVIGDPIAHSKSPLIHNFWLSKLGIDAEYRACHVRPGELAGYFARRRGDARWRGCNVTIPHKQTVIRVLDRLDSRAQRIGAVNTVVRNADATLAGFNSDAAGFLEPLRPLSVRDNDGRRELALVLGAGGAARAVVCALWDEGYHIDILNRDVAKARSLSDAFGTPDTSFGPLEQPSAPLLYSSGGSPNLLVNTTSLGMDGMPPLDISLSRVSANTIVYDLVYSPLRTPLLVEAQARGMKTIDGLAMLIGQAATAFARFFGVPPPREYDAELRALLTA
ncbi:MAG: shikimate dehydrogenase [Novosphingobium sp.]